MKLKEVGVVEMIDGVVEAQEKILLITCMILSLPPHIQAYSLTNASSFKLMLVQFNQVIELNSKGVSSKGEISILCIATLKNAEDSMYKASKPDLIKHISKLVIGRLS